MPGAAQFTLYGHSGHGPNPPKVAILLEALGLTYEIIALPFGEKGVKSATYLKLNPNGRLPYLVDHANNDYAVWESGACLYYLVEKYDKEGKFFGRSVEEKADVLKWTLYQLSGLGPIQGQMNWFNLYHEKTHGEPANTSVVKRYRDETERIYKVLETRITEQETKGVKYMTTDRFTIADISFYVWLNVPELGGPYLQEMQKRYPKLCVYRDSIKAMPIVQKAEDRIHHVTETTY